MTEKTKPVEISPLGKFEGEDVLTATVTITRAGDGLSDALAVHPVELHRGDRVQVVLDCEVAEISFPGIKGAANALARRHKLVTISATIVDEDVVRAALDATKRAVEERKGIQSIPFADKDPDAPDVPGDAGNGEVPPSRSRSRGKPAE
jgi:hypothetical protein